MLADGKSNFSRRATTWEPIMSTHSATIIAAVFTAIATIVAALINVNSTTVNSATPAKSTIEDCERIPATTNARPPPARTGYVWVPADFILSAGRLEEIAGHWERKKDGGRDRFVPGHWEVSTGSCVWVRAEFVAGDP